MTVFSGLAHRVVTEAERHLREGFGLIARIVRDDRERTEEIERLLPAYGERIRRLEKALAGQDADLRGLRTELDSLVGQLNDRLLPRIDERMDDTERDLTTVATGLVRTGKETTSNRTRLEAVEARVSDLRGKLVQMEQRAGLWRELQANMARLGDDIDTLRARLGTRRVDPAGDPVGAEQRRVDETFSHSEARP